MRKSASGSRARKKCLPTEDTERTEGEVFSCKLGDVSRWLHRFLRFASLRVNHLQKSAFICGQQEVI